MKKYKQLDVYKRQVIHIMDEQKDITKKGGTMRLGSYPCLLKENSKVKELYGKENILERHRHRFESVSYTHLNEDENW